MNKVRYLTIVLFLSASVLLPLSASASGMSCQEFDALSGVSTHEEFKHSHWTGAQFEAFKSVIASHVGDIASLHRFSRRNTALQSVLKNRQMLSYIMSNALSMTIDFCVDRKNNPMSDVAIEQFDYLLDAVAGGMDK